MNHTEHKSELSLRSTISNPLANNVTGIYSNLYMLNIYMNVY